MRIGQTSLIVFLSKIVASVLGFVATVYFARFLGAEILGIYSGIIALTSWLQLLSGPGVGIATRKRISEGDQPGEYMAAGLFLFGGSLLLIATLVVVFQGVVESYIGGFAQYSSLSVIWFVVAILITAISSSYVSIVLEGQHLVHVAGFLNTSRTALRSIIQITLVFIGLNVVGMLLGYMVAAFMVSLIGLRFISIRPRRPSLKHINSLLSYAKYSWLGGMKSMAFSNLDILVLTALVPTTLVGVYSAAWSLTMFISLFGAAVGQAIFPEVSKLTNENNIKEVKGIVEDAVTFAGIIAIPGLVGGALLADRVLRIYGDRFVEGTEVLWLLILSILLFSYMRQFLNALNAMDRPELAFRVNVIFVLSNVVLNVSLVVQFGWVGAAVASTVSTGIGLVLSYTLLSGIIPINIPIEELCKQGLAALVMGAVVWGIRRAIETNEIVQHNFAIVFSLVTVGTILYVGILLGISSVFRQIVDRNLPFRVPYGYQK